MNKTKISRFLLAVVLLVVAALSVVACNDKTYKINVTCDSAKGTYELAPEADSYKNGDEVTLTVTANEGYEVDSVKQDNNALTGNGNNYKITVKDADVNVVITFKEKAVTPPAPTTYTIDVDCDEAKASYELDPTKTAYSEGDKVKLTVTVKDDNVIKSVKANGTALTAAADGSYELTVGTENINVVVEFEEKVTPPTPVTTYTINVTCENGTYALDPVKEKYEEGDEVKLTVTPNEGYEVKSVKANETALTAEADGSYKLTVGTENINVVVTLEEKVTPPTPVTTYTINVTCENGTYALDPVKEKYEEGDEVKLTVTANEGYEVKSVKANETALTAEADGSYKLTVGTENINVVVTLEEKVTPPTTYTVTVACGENGTYALNPQKDAYNEGEEVTLTLTPSEGYVVDYVKCNDIDIAAAEGNTYKLTVTENLSVSIAFKEEGELPPAPSNLWTGEGAGTAANPYILSGLNGTITVPHAGLKPDGKPSYTKEWMKWAPAESGRYTLKSVSGENVPADLRIKVCKNGTSSMLGSISTDTAMGQNFIEFDASAGVNEVWISYSSFVNFNTEITLVFEKTEIPTTPDTSAADYVGTWTGSSIKLIITMTSDTQLNGEFYYGGQLAANYTFVKGSNNAWLDSQEGYTVFYNAENNTITFSDGTTSNTHTLKKESSEKPPVTDSQADKYVGIWENDYDFVQDQVKLTIIKTSNTDLSVKQEKMTGSPINYFFTFKDGVWSEIEFPSRTLQINQDGTLTYNDGAIRSTVLKKIGDVTVDLSVFVGEWNVGSIGEKTTIALGTEQNTLTMSLLGMDVVLTLGSDGALTGTSLMGQNFKLEQKAGKIILTITFNAVDESYELTKAAAEEGLVPEQFRGTWESLEGKWKGTSYEAGAFVINATANEFTLTANGVKQTLENLGVIETDDTYFKFDWVEQGETYYVYYNSDTKIYYIMTNTDTFANQISFNIKTGSTPDVPDVPDVPALNIADCFIGTWNGDGYTVVITATSVALSQSGHEFVLENIAATDTQITFDVSDMNGINAYLVYDQASGKLNFYVMMVDPGNENAILTKAN